MIRAVFGSLSAVAGVGLSVSVGIAAVALAVVLARRRFRDPEKRLGSDAAVTLGLAGLPAPVFFGAYYTVSPRPDLGVSATMTRDGRRGDHARGN